MIVVKVKKAEVDHRATIIKVLAVVMIPEITEKRKIIAKKIIKRKKEEIPLHILHLIQEVIVVVEVGVEVEVKAILLQEVALMIRKKNIEDDKVDYYNQLVYLEKINIIINNYSV